MLSSIVTHPLFAKHYTVARQVSMEVNGRQEIFHSEPMAYYGAVQPTTHKDMHQLPEHDRHNDSMTFFTTPPHTFELYDIATYEGRRYRIISVLDWTQYGHVQGIGVEVLIDD